MSRGIFHLNGLNHDDAAHILDTVPIVRREDDEEHGHCRTKDTILEISAALAKSHRTAQPYQTCLNPPPADPRCCHLPQTKKKANE